MKANLRSIFGILLSAGFVALLFPAFFFIRDNDISKANRLKEKARREYFAREFLSAYKTYETLIDSTGDYDDAALINFANAGLMSSNILRGGFYGRSNGPMLSDTILQQMALESQDIYTILTISDNKKIASMAHNQLGYAVIKSNKSYEAENADSVLTGALQNFKEALKKNPNNDSARYNYELLKKVLGFPETILSQTRALVAEKRYIEAANLLEASMERDIRLAKQKDFLQRIKAVAGIDTTYRRRRI